MPINVKKIGILTSGGDSPGMNAAIRSVVRCALNQNINVVGIVNGYEGILTENMYEMSRLSVSNIIDRGGTILKTARSKRFKTEEGEKLAVANLRKHEIDALVVIGGDGSYRGAAMLYEKYGFPTIGLPGTIDNDLNGTDYTIGCHTAVNTAMEAIDKVRDTAHSMERIFIIEVMGNKSGYLAMQVALASGAEDVIIPERQFDLHKIENEIKKGYEKGKISWMIIVAEGAAKAHDIAEAINDRTGFETRYVVLGHVQRGGSPTGLDRIYSTRLGSAAVECLIKGQFGKAVGICKDEINLIDLKDAAGKEFSHIDDYYKLVRLIT